MPRPLTCTKCCGPAVVIERVVGYLEWGPAVIDDDGIVRPTSQPLADVLDHNNSSPQGRPIAVCEADACGHQWRLRRRFDPAERS